MPSLLKKEKVEKILATEAQEILCQSAKRGRLGKKLPLNWFMQDVHP